MQANELLEIIPKLQQIQGLSKLAQIKTCGLECQPKPFSLSESEKVLEELETFKPEQGWLCFQNKVK